MSAEPAPVDLVVTGRIVTMDTQRRIIRDGAVATRDGRIVAVGERADILAGFAAARMLDAPNQIITPGFSDCHTHSTQSLVRGLIAGELPMIYRLYIPADMELTPDEAYLGARLWRGAACAFGRHDRLRFRQRDKPGARGCNHRRNARCRPAPRLLPG